MCGLNYEFIKRKSETKIELNYDLIREPQTIIARIKVLNTLKYFNIERLIGGC